MIEYTYSYFDQKDVVVSTSKQNDRWACNMVHKPTGIFIRGSGVGKFEHQVEQRRQMMDHLKQQVDVHYDNEYKQYATDQIIP